MQKSTESMHFIVLLLSFIVSTCFCSENWNLVWSDDFNQPIGSGPDLNKWNFEIGILFSFFCTIVSFVLTIYQIPLLCFSFCM